MLYIGYIYIYINKTNNANWCTCQSKDVFRILLIACAMCVNHQSEHHLNTFRYLAIIENDTKCWSLKYWKYWEKISELVFILFGIRALRFHFWVLWSLYIKLKLEFFIVKLCSTRLDLYRLSTEILPNILELILHLIFIVNCYINVLKFDEFQGKHYLL